LRDQNNQFVNIIKEHPAQLQANLMSSEVEKMALQEKLDYCQKKLTRLEGAQEERERVENNAPSMAITYKGGDPYSELSIKNDSTHDARNVTVGAIEYVRRYLLDRIPDNFARLDGKETKCLRIRLDISPIEETSRTFSAMLGKPVDEPDTIVSVAARRGECNVEVTFEDIDGNKFKQPFELEAHKGNIIDWKPGKTKLRR
jgi:hypothetical protein